MANTPDAATATVVGAVLAAVAVLGSSWFNKVTQESAARRASRDLGRRDAIAARREADKRKDYDLEMCEITCDRLQADVASLHARNSMLIGLLIAKNIPIPPER